MEGLEVRNVSHYKIIMNPIAAGSFGALYEAIDNDNLSERLACK